MLSLRISSFNESEEVFGRRSTCFPAAKIAVLCRQWAVKDAFDGKGFGRFRERS